MKDIAYYEAEAARLRAEYETWRCVESYLARCNISNLEIESHWSFIVGAHSCGVVYTFDGTIYTAIMYASMEDHDETFFVKSVYPITVLELYDEVLARRCSSLKGSLRAQSKATTLKILERHKGIK